MKVLLTGANGYIGKRLLPVLINQGHSVVCLVRDRKRFEPPRAIPKRQITVIEGDLLNYETLKNIPNDINAAYYLVHSMSSAKDYEQLEINSARNFKRALNGTCVDHVIYLSGISNENALSKHLRSRMNVENELISKDNYRLTILRSGIIIGSGSASFEIIRDLVEKLPIMVAPKWLNTRAQPISIHDVIETLFQCLVHTELQGKVYDIGGPDVLTYKEMLLGLAKVRHLKRTILTVPVMTPRLSSYWLYFVTSTPFKLAMALVDSMKVEVTCKGENLLDKLGIKPLTYQQSLRNAFRKIESNQIVSSWKDSFVSGEIDFNVSDYIKVPTFGCFVDQRYAKITSINKTKNKIWNIGGSTGWYHADFLWKLRGFLDRLFGGVGLRRGRTNTSSLSVGDAIDFWRVLYANKDEGRLLLFAEMKLPGEAWLELKIDQEQLSQTATFRPKGVLGRLYWYAVSPLHDYVFSGMLRKLTA
ncbi:MAG: SDR family oxidoreductase [Cyclobacteriaceae bacterium]